jgi:hypothetical protein
MKLDVHYFAWLRERLGTGRETVETEADTVAELIEELRARDEGYAFAFSGHRCDPGRRRSGTGGVRRPARRRARGRVLPADDRGLERMEPVRVQEAAFDPGQELNAFTATVEGAGAVVSFSGITRDLVGGSLRTMEIEHYPGMTEKALAAIRDEAMDAVFPVGGDDPAPLRSAWCR